MKRYIIIAILLLPALFACTNDSNGGNEGATGVVLNKEKIDLMVGETAELTATVMPESLGMGVVWSVIDPEYAEVSGGTVTGKAEGVTYVVATSEDGYKKAACMVSVNPPVKYSVTVKNDRGVPVTEIYGYPGMTERLYVSTSDGEAHQLTWSVVDNTAASITSDGNLTLSAVNSANTDYIYDVQSSVKVITEDNLGCLIPLRSSLLKGLLLDGEYQAAGGAITVLESERYPIAAVYQGADAPLAIPVDGINLELTNSTDFSLELEDGVFSLVVGNTSNASTKLLASVIGSTEKVELAEFRVDEDFPIRARLINTSSSTLSFTWTEGDGESVDVTKPYTIALYKDADCSDLEIEYNIPANDGCWNGHQPSFVFSGLAPATDYWFKVTDTSGEDITSGVIPATTDAFNIVMVSDTPASVGDIILAEDFSQLCWGADEVSQSAGFDSADSSLDYKTDTGKLFTDRTPARFVGTTGQYAQRSLTAQKTAAKAPGFRLAKWAQGQFNRMYVGPGYVFLSTTSYGTHIITPELINIPDDTSAKLLITLHAAGKYSGGKAVLAVQHNKSFSQISSGTETNKNKLDLTSNIQTITFEGGITNLQEFEVTIDGVVNGDRIAFGPTSETDKSNANMMILSDMTIEILELSNE